MARYSPSPAPHDVEYLTRYIAEELLKIQTVINQGSFEVTYVEPTRPQDGQVEYADGTEWSPNAEGRGIYYYNDDSTLWVKLG